MILINEARILGSKLDFTLVHIVKLAIVRNNSINCEWLHVESNKIIIVKKFQDVILTKTKRNETKRIGGDEFDEMKGKSMVVHASTNINPPRKDL